MMKSVKIKTVVFVNFSINWGGGEVQHLSLAKEFISQGYHSIIVCQLNSALWKKATEQGISVQLLNVSKLSFLNLRKLHHIRKMLKKIQPSAIILNSSLELKHFAFATSHKRYNLIYRRGFHAPIKLNNVNKFCFERLNRVVAISEFVKNSTLKKLSPFCRNPIVVINNGIPPLFDFDLPKYNSKRIIAIGRLVAYKQFDILIKAMPTLLKFEPQAELWIVGEGEERQNLERLIIDLNLSENVFLKGFSSDIPSLISQSALLVHPASEEAFGVVFLEAMRQKIASVTFEGHAGDEIIENGLTGLLIKERSPESLALGISRIISDETMLKEMGINAFNRFNNCFTIEHSVQNYIKLIKQA